MTPAHADRARNSRTAAWACPFTGPEEMKGRAGRASPGLYDLSVGKKASREFFTVAVFKHKLFEAFVKLLLDTCI